MGADTLIEDIYGLVSTKEVADGVDIDKEIETFGESIKELMRTEFKKDRPKDTRRLRLSSVGRTDRFLWNQYHGSVGEELQPHTLVKFLYGHVIEELILFLTRASGHEVTCEQKRCEVEGVVGHMDCKIDGIVTDVKSASTFAFKKFKERRVPEDDPFGYVDQIKAYAHSEGERKFAWLAMDKQNGHLTFCQHDLDDESDPMHDLLKGDIAERIRHVKKLVEGEEPSEFCYPDVPDGKSGNRKLSVGCSYCQFREKCYPDLRTFTYSYGPKYLTKVVKQPYVSEVPDGF
jgi:hypothetical protein